MANENKRLSGAEIACVAVGIVIGFIIVQYGFGLGGALGGALGGGLGAALGLGIAKVLGVGAKKE